MVDMVLSILQYRKKVSVVLIDAYSSRAFWYVFGIALLCRAFKIPYVPIIHGGNFPARLVQSKVASRRIFSNSLINVSPSIYLKEHFESNHFAVKYIPNFIELNNYPFLSRRKVVPRLLWVRSFHKLYNPLLAIDVLASLKEDYPNASLCMIGPDKDGSLSLAKQRAASLKVEDSITFTGLLSKRDWIDKSADFDIFINTTNFDNMPISVIEAMALGLPIVSTNVGGLPYLIDNGKEGLLVEPDSVYNFVSAIKTIMADTQLANDLAKNARLKAESFDWKNIAPFWKEIIDQNKSTLN